MARSQSFGKRENEKKKQAKRLEKQKRKEDRMTGGTTSLDDMIAYVDENGNITDTPPEKREKTEIELEDIVIATPKKEAGWSISMRKKVTVSSRTWPLRRNIFSTYLPLRKESARVKSSISNLNGERAA